MDQAEKNLRLLLSYAEGTVSFKDYRKAVKYPSGFVANLKSDLLVEDEQLDYGPRTIAEHFMPFVDGCREYLNQHGYLIVPENLEELQFTFKESRNNEERAKRLTKSIVVAVKIGGEYDAFKKAYDNLDVVLSRMPKDIKSLESDIVKSLDVVDVRFQMCVEAFVEFENCRRSLISNMNKHAQGLRIGEMMQLGMQQTPIQIRDIMSNMSAGDAPNGGEVGNKNRT